MNWKPAALGAERKKMAMLAGLVAVAIYMLWPSSAPESATPARARPASGLISAPSGPRAAAAHHNRLVSHGEFRPSLRLRGDDIDRTKIDPTLRTDLLAKLQNVKVETGSRSLFDFGAAPAPVLAGIKEPAKIIPHRRFVGPMPPKPEVKQAAVKPPAPPIPLKFYGYLSPAKSGAKRAFFLDGEEIVVATEGETIKKRYKVVRIGINSAVLEDTQFENNQQTIPLAEEAQS